ncbi:MULTISPECIES: phage major capsid protein [unclassified Yoonia]|uniref:phage major capsid protein n=1 Tax=unclassified Yoonia TaxID=2629118 RepID=UPI002AFDCE85|nr:MULTISPECIES: phage major capsid protein [unclassified Yoonia]
MPKDLNDLRRDRKAAAAAMQTCADKIATLEAAEKPDATAIAAAVAEFETAEAAFKDVSARVARAEAVEAAQAAAAGDGDVQDPPAPRPAATAKNPEHAGIEIGFMMSALANTKGDKDKAVKQLEKDGHSGISASLSGATEGAGGVTIPRAQATDIIGLLRARVTVRASGARTIDMPAGQLRHARQSSAATASYGAELAPSAPSQPGFDAVQQNFKKLTSLVPISNTLLRQSSVAMAMLVRDDMLRVMALREDLAFLRNDGTGDLPKGLLSWMPAANFETGVAATAAAAEAAVRRAVDRVEEGNVAMVRPGWIMRPSAKNWLANLRDANGNLLFPSIDQNGTLRGFAIQTTTQLPNNLGVGTDETEVIFADFDEIMIGDSLVVTISSSTEAAYVEGGETKSAFQKDQTLMRTVAEHDLAPAHDAAIAGFRGAGWSL